jgi:hypothetical protein
MDEPNLAEVRRLSRTLFGGARYRIEVAVAIASSDGMVCLTDLARAVGDPAGKGSVNVELKILERTGLLVRAEPLPGERRVFLIRRPSPYRELCRA